MSSVSTTKAASSKDIRNAPPSMKDTGRVKLGNGGSVRR